MGELIYRLVHVSVYDVSRDRFVASAALRFRGAERITVCTYTLRKAYVPTTGRANRCFIVLEKEKKLNWTGANRHLTTLTLVNDIDFPVSWTTRPAKYLARQCT